MIIEIDDDFLNELESNATTTKVDLTNVPYVNCGLFRCFATSSFKQFNENDGSVKISCQFAVYEDDMSNIVGKFSTKFDLDPSSKFFTKTKEFIWLTGNKKGIDENTFTDKNGKELTNFPALERKPLVVALYRKPTDYITQTGEARPNYTLYGIYGEDKLSVRERLRSITDANDVKQTFSFLKSKVAKDGGTFNKPDPIEIKPVEPVKPAKVEPAIVEPAIETSDDELPF